MIFDSISNREFYFNSPVFKEIFHKINSITIDTPNGTYYKTENYYFKVMSYYTKKIPTLIESHKKEVDIQILLSGSEHIKIYGKDQVEVISKYSEETDCQFYKSSSKPEIELDLFPGKMAVFFPQDIHSCQYAVNSKVENLKKIVIKINEELFTQ